MRTRASRFAGYGLSIATLLCPVGAAAVEEAFPTQAANLSPKAQDTAALRSSPDGALMRIALDPPDASSIEAIRKSNSAQKVLQIGIGRSLAGRLGIESDSLAWQPVQGGMAARWEIESAGARALRIGLEVRQLPPLAELRFVGSGDPAVNYGPFTAADLRLMQPVYWSPVLEGGRALVEIFIQSGVAPSEVSVSLSAVAHLFVSPSDENAEIAAKAAGACQVDLICRSASDSALAFAAKSVARMSYNVGSTPYLCTGTLMVTTAGVGHPYFYTSSVCIADQASASTLTTHWFYDRTGCGFGATNPGYVQLTGGATLLYVNTTTDATLLRLNAPPPAGVVYAGWSAAALATGTALTGVHHPLGDWKKVSLGSAGGFSGYGGGAGSTYLIVLWNSTATGVTEPGSAGSVAFSSSSSGYQLRGALKGGPSSCTASGADLRDYYSRFDQAYSAISAYLNPPFTNVLANPGFESGAVGWGQQSTGGYSLITSEPGTAFSGSYDAWLGGYESGTDTLYQDVTIPANADMVRMDFRYRILTAEPSGVRDTLTVSINSPSSGALLSTLATYSNANANTVWELSPNFDLTAFRGQTVRLKFTAVNDALNISSFRVDDIRLLAVYTSVSEADTTVTQVTSSNPASAGKDVLVSLTATNFGPGTASGVTVSYPVPPGVPFMWASPGCSNDAGTIRCTANTLVVGGTRRFKIVLRPASAGSFTSIASISTSTTDPFTANNSISAAVTVNATPLGTPVFRYRLYSPVTLEHHFTTDLNEYSTLGTYSGTWVQEGTVGKVLNNPGPFNGVATVPYYRLYDTATRWHHWTTDVNEYYTLAEFPSWNAEGVDGYILATNPSGTTQLYRLLYPFIAGLHHWTIDANEYSTLINSYGWIGEGGSGYVVFP